MFDWLRRKPQIITIVIPPEIRTLELKEDDLIVLRHPGRLSRDAREGLSTAWRKMWEGTGHRPAKLIIFEEGLTVDIMRDKRDRCLPPKPMPGLEFSGKG